MARLWEFICDVCTSSPAALLAVLTAGPVLACIAWLTFQVLRQL